MPKHTVSGSSPRQYKTVKQCSAPGDAAAPPHPCPLMVKILSFFNELMVE